MLIKLCHRGKKYQSPFFLSSLQQTPNKNRAVLKNKLTKNKNTHTTTRYIRLHMICIHKWLNSKWQQQQQEQQKNRHDCKRKKKKKKKKVEEEEEVRDEAKASCSLYNQVYIKQKP